MKKYIFFIGFLTSCLVSSPQCLITKSTGEDGSYDCAPVIFRATVHSQDLVSYIRAGFSLKPEVTKQSFISWLEISEGLENLAEFHRRPDLVERIQEYFPQEGRFFPQQDNLSRLDFCLQTLSSMHPASKTHVTNFPVWFNSLPTKLDSFAAFSLVFIFESDATHIVMPYPAGTHIKFKTEASLPHSLHLMPVEDLLLVANTYAKLPILIHLPDGYINGSYSTHVEIDIHKYLSRFEAEDQADMLNPQQDKGIVPCPRAEIPMRYKLVSTTPGL